MVTDLRRLVGGRGHSAAMAILALVLVVLAGAPGVRAEPTAEAGDAPSLVGAWLIRGNPDNPAQREVALFTADGLALRSSAPSSPERPGCTAVRISACGNHSGGVSTP